MRHVVEATIVDDTRSGVDAVKGGGGMVVTDVGEVDKLFAVDGSEVICWFSEVKLTAVGPEIFESQPFKFSLYSKTFASDSYLPDVFSVGHSSPASVWYGPGLKQ